MKTHRRRGFWWLWGYYLIIWGVVFLPTTLLSIVTWGQVHAVESTISFLSRGIDVYVGVNAFLITGYVVLTTECSFYAALIRFLQSKHDAKVLRRAVASIQPGESEKNVVGILLRSCEGEVNTTTEDGRTTYLLDTDWLSVTLVCSRGRVECAFAQFV